MFVHQHLWFNLQNQIHLVRALAGATLRYCSLLQPAGAQRVRGFRFERIRARDANGLVTCFLNQPLGPEYASLSSGLCWLQRNTNATNFTIPAAQFRLFSGDISQKKPVLRRRYFLFCSTCTHHRRARFAQRRASRLCPSAFDRMDAFNVP
jgi:hypothetical protein